MINKKWILTGILTVCCAVSLQAKTGADDTVQAPGPDGVLKPYKMISVDKDGKTVKLGSGSTYTNLPINQLSQPDQSKLLDWQKDKLFKSSGGLKIQLRENEEKEKVNTKTKQNSTETRMRGKKLKVDYEITLENRSAFSLENIKVEYLMFYENGVEKSEVKRIMSGTFDCTLTPKETKTFTTEQLSLAEMVTQTVRISEETGDAGDQTTIRRKEQLEGILVTVTREDRNGEAVTREMKDGRIPKEEKWSDYQR